MSLYLFREGSYKDAIHYTLKGLELSDKFNDMVFDKRSTALFEEASDLLASVGMEKLTILVVLNLLSNNYIE
jgi:hypothetical protein